jgi:hypothetical protein
MGAHGGPILLALALMLAIILAVEPRQSGPVPQHDLT